MISEATFGARGEDFNCSKPFHRNDLSHSTPSQGLTQVFGHLHADMEAWRPCEIVLSALPAATLPHDTP